MMRKMVKAAAVMALAFMVVPGRGEAGETTGETLLQFAPRAKTSQRMTGLSLVVLLFIESDGSKEPSTEDWSGEQMGHVEDELGWALGRYEELAPCDAGASFRVMTQTVGCGYEPIAHHATDSDAWRNDVMLRLGASGEEAYADRLRREHGTDWAFVVYAVNSANDGDGLFPGGWMGFAYFCGPVMACASGSGWLRSCFMHEVGHVYCALDQRGNDGPCWAMGGYNLDVPNLNSLTGVCQGQTQFPSVMRWPWEYDVDPYMARQIGWEVHHSYVYLPICQKFCSTTCR
jgi:hypothetical protein